MRTRRIYLGLLLIAVAVGAIVVCFRPEREPEYEGKKLSEWVRELPSNYFQTGESDAQRAIRHIGTNAIPYLLKWMRYEVPNGKDKLYRAVNQVIKRLHMPRRIFNQKEERARAAGLALEVLGLEVVRAIPELTRILTDPKEPASAYRASSILAGLGEAGLPPLLLVLTNAQTRLNLREAVGIDIEYYATNGRLAVPEFQQMLTNTEFLLRHIATNALRKFDPQALERAVR